MGRGWYRLRVGPHRGVGPHRARRWGRWMSWLRERVESKTGRTVPLPPRNQPWLPSVLVHVAPAVVSALTYAVIDERDQPDGLLSFVLSGWPRLDDLGRVRHRHNRLVGVAVPSGDWQVMLAERRVPEVLRDRPPRIGDAFGMMLERRVARHLLDPIGPVVDVTADGGTRRGPRSMALLRLRWTRQWRPRSRNRRIGSGRCPSPRTGGRT